MCLGETVIILFAVRLHAPDFVVAAIGSMMFLGFLLLPLGVLRTAQAGAARSQADFWVYRNIAAMLVAVGAPASLVSLPLSWGLMQLGAFLFYGFRAAGVVMSQPLIGDITTPQDRAKLIADSTCLFYISGLTAMTAVSITVFHFDNIWTLTAIIVAGAMLGVTASSFLRRIDETSAISRSARAPLLPQLRIAWGDRILRRQIYAGFMVNLAIIMLVPISILTVKRGYGMSDTQALIFSIVQFASSIAGTQISGKLTNRFGAYKVALWAYCLMIFPVCLFWLTAPEQMGSGILFMLPFVLIGTTMVSMQNAMTHYFLATVPKERQVASAMFISLLTGAAAGLCGMMLTGFMLKLAVIFFGSGLLQYRGYFALAALIFLAGLRLISKLSARN